MRIILFALGLMFVGCMSQEERQAQIQRKAESDRAFRREHMRNTGAVRDNEYEALNKATRDFTPQATGIPPAPAQSKNKLRMQVRCTVQRGSW